MAYTFTPGDIIIIICASLAIMAILAHYFFCKEDIF